MDQSISMGGMENLGKIIERVLSRAEHSRRVYNVNIALMLMLIVLLAILFVFGGFKGVSGEGDISSNTMIFLLVSSGIVRVGAVAVGVYGIQIMFNLARYHMRLSQHLLSTADALELSDGDAEKLDKLLKSITPVNLDFGKHPTSTTDKMGAIVEELVRKIPNQNHNK